MTILLRCVLCVGFCVLATNPATAVTITIDGEAACRSINGEWDASSCVVHRLTVPAGTTLIFPSNVGLLGDDTIVNDGVIETRSYFRPYRMNNRGTLRTYGITVNEGVVTSTGTFHNYGWLHPHQAVLNYGTFTNDGYFETCAGAFVNYGYMFNRSSIENWGGWIINEGIAVNDGDFYNPDSDWYMLLNRGAFENNGIVYNGGRIVTECGGAWYGPGSLDGNPVEYPGCPTGAMFDPVIQAVFALAPPNGTILTKDQAIDLTSLLGKAQKGVRGIGESIALLNRFIDEVEALVDAGTLPALDGRALVERAQTIVEWLEAER